MLLAIYPYKAFYDIVLNIWVFNMIIYHKFIYVSKNTNFNGKIQNYL